MWASQNGNLDVVNRLLDCKEIDVNGQREVSGFVNLWMDGWNFGFLFQIPKLK